ncbi:MAG: hypothetical protein KC621_34450, partial [Myxococcales bacterium]|nr:hypothetical protein [Myxococcales bacterium]
MDAKLLRSVRDLLQTRDHAATRQGVELAVALGDPALFDALLEGVVWDAEAEVELQVPGWR